MRTLEGHKVNPANDTLHIAVVDTPGAGGACHAYHISGFSAATNPSAPVPGISGSLILFQNGPISEAGVNGITHEALLAILIDRLEAFQAGPYACPENAQALKFLVDAQETLKMRTQRRMDRGVEGTHKI